jgi:hypothetical protein
MTTFDYAGATSKRTRKAPDRELTVHAIVALLILGVLALDIVKAEPALNDGGVLPLKLIAGRVAPS